MYLEAVEMFFLLFLSKFVLSQAQADEACSSITMDISVPPTFRPKNKCDKKDFECRSPEISFETDHFRYNQQCRMINISDYEARLEHYKLIEHNGIVIVGDNIDSCVKGGITSVEKSYRRIKKYKELLEPRYDEGESAPRVQFVSYEDGVFSNSTIDSEGKVLPICTQVVMVSATVGKRPDTSLIQLHCGNPSELINKCYVLPNSKTKRIEKIQVNSSKSKKLTDVFERLKFPTYAIEDMNYKIENGCFNKGKVSSSQLVYSWDMPKEKLHESFSSCVTSDGFSYIKGENFDILETNTNDMTAFNFEDVAVLEENLKEKNETTYLEPQIITKQIPIAQERLEKYNTCLSNLETQYKSLQQNSVLQEYQIIIDLYKSLIKTQEMHEENIKRLHNEMLQSIPSKKSHISTLYSQLTQEVAVLSNLFTRNEYSYQSDAQLLNQELSNFFEIQNTKLQSEGVFWDNQRKDIYDEQIILAEHQEETLVIQSNLSPYIKVETVSIPNLDVNKIPYSTEGIATCENQILEIQELQKLLLEYANKLNLIEDKLSLFKDNVSLYKQQLDRAKQQQQIIDSRTITIPHINRKSFVSKQSIRRFTKVQTYYFEHEEIIDRSVWNTTKLAFRIFTFIL